MNEYENDIAIDPEFLEEEWLRQPSLYFKYSDMKRQAAEDQSKAKDKLELWKAQTSLRIRSDPEGFGIKKATNDSVAEKILVLLSEGPMDKEDIDGFGFNHKKAYDEATYRLNVFGNVLSSLDHKKKALEMLVQLHVSNWFSGPKEPKNIPPGKRIADKKSGETAEKIRDAGKKRSRRNRG